jgi:NTP pyrophosphatase (non-canonical NTP hydrolase)
VGWVYAPDEDGFWLQGPFDPGEFTTGTFFPPDARVMRVDPGGHATEVRWDVFLKGPPLAPGERARLPGDPNGAGPMAYVVSRLREPGGCPWDREQTPHTLLRYLLDEAYEAAAAISAEDWGLAEDELGDVLLQVVLQARIQEEAGRFDFGRVAAAQASKLTGRHPHVFRDVQASSPEEVLESWDRLKALEPTKGHGDETVMPALMAYSRAFKRGEVALSEAGRAQMDHLLQTGVDLSAEDRRRLLRDWLSAAVASAQTWHEEAEWVLWEGLPRPRKKL